MKIAHRGLTISLEGLNRREPWSTSGNLEPYGNSIILINELHCLCFQKISSCQNTIRTLNNSADKQEKKMKEYSEKIQSLKEQLVSKAEQFANIYESKEKLQGEKDGL